MSGEALETTVFTGREGLEEIRDAWRRAASGMGRRRYFHDIRWYQSYLEVLEHEPQRVHFFVFRTDGEAVAVIPLRRSEVTRAGIRVRVLEIPHHEFLKEGDFVIGERQDLKTLSSQLLAALRSDPRFQWDVLRLPHVLEDSRALALVREIKGYLVQQRDTGGCDYIHCPTGKDPLADLSKKMRKQLRRATNKLNALGTNSFVSYRRGAELEHAFEQLLDLEQSGWKGKAGTAMRSLADKERLFRRLVALYSATGDLEVNLLQVNDLPIGGTLAFRLDDTCYGMKIARDQRYPEVSAGHLLMQELLTRCSRSSGINYLNLVSDAGWNDRWRPSCYRVYDYHLCNWTIGGVAQFAALTRAKHRAQKAVAADA